MDEDQRPHGRWRGAWPVPRRLGPVLRCASSAPTSAEGVPIWGVSVQNEPLADQRWDSCLYSAEEARLRARPPRPCAARRRPRRREDRDLGPQPRPDGRARRRRLFRPGTAAAFVWGTGFHWYGPECFDHVQQVHDAWPDKHLLFTEGCQEGGPHLGSWGRRALRAQRHPDLNRWTVGWIDWNLLLDERGGPNHVGNFCSAPILADTARGVLMHQSAFWVLGHFALHPPRRGRVLADAAQGHRRHGRSPTPTAPSPWWRRNPHDEALRFALDIDGDVGRQPTCRRARSPPSSADRPPDARRFVDDDDGQTWYRIDRHRRRAAVLRRAGQRQRRVGLRLHRRARWPPGRRDAEGAFFPYETVDRIHRRWRAHRPAPGSVSTAARLWLPFAPRLTGGGGVRCGRTCRARACVFARTIRRAWSSSTSGRAPPALGHRAHRRVCARRPAGGGGGARRRARPRAAGRQRLPRDDDELPGRRLQVERWPPAVAWACSRSTPASGTAPSQKESFEALVAWHAGVPDCRARCCRTTRWVRSAGQRAVAAETLTARPRVPSSSSSHASVDARPRVAPGDRLARCRRCRWPNSCAGSTPAAARPEITRALAANDTGVDESARARRRPAALGGPDGCGAPPRQRALQHHARRRLRRRHHARPRRPARLRRAAASAHDRPSAWPRVRAWPRASNAQASATRAPLPVPASARAGLPAAHLQPPPRRPEAVRGTGSASACATRPAGVVVAYEGNWRDIFQNWGRCSPASRRSRAR